MIRLILGIAIVLGLVSGMHFLLSLEDTITINTGAFIYQPRVGLVIAALVILMLLAILGWAILRRIIGLPGFLGHRRKLNRLRSGLHHLSQAIIATEAGLYDKARQLAKTATKALPNNIAAQLLQAKSAAQSGHFQEARDIWRTMIEDETSAPVALKGLFDEAKKRNNTKAALIFARKAIALAPETIWANLCIFDDFLSHRQWLAALDFVKQNKAHNAFKPEKAGRFMLVLNTAIADENQIDAPALALQHAKAALKLDKGFVPATLIAARLLAAQSKYRAASNILTRAYKMGAHPHLAELYASLRDDMNAEQQWARMEHIAQFQTLDGDVAQIIAKFALKADNVARARDVLTPFAKDTPTQNICALMAKIEAHNINLASNDTSRQWLAASLDAPADKCWTADGFKAENWSPLSPTNAFDVFEWQIPLKEAAGPKKLQLPELDWQSTDKQAEAG